MKTKNLKDLRKDKKFNNHYKRYCSINKPIWYYWVMTFALLLILIGSMWNTVFESLYFIILDVIIGFAFIGGYAMLNSYYYVKKIMDSTKLEGNK